VGPGLRVLPPLARARVREKLCRDVEPTAGVIDSQSVKADTAAQVLLRQVADTHHQLALVWADGGYTGSLVAHLMRTRRLARPHPQRA